MPGELGAHDGGIRAGLFAGEVLADVCGCLAVELLEVAQLRVRAEDRIVLRRGVELQDEPVFARGFARHGDQLRGAWIVGPIFMGKSMAVATLIIAFSVSTIGGTIIGIIALHLLRKVKIWQPESV